MHEIDLVVDGLRADLENSRHALYRILVDEQLEKQAVFVGFQLFAAARLLLENATTERTEPPRNIQVLASPTVMLLDLRMIEGAYPVIGALRRRTRGIRIREEIGREAVEILLDTEVAFQGNRLAAFRAEQSLAALDP